MENPVNEYIPQPSEFRRQSNYPMPFNVIPGFEDPYSGSVYQKVNHHSPPTYYNHPIPKYPENMNSNYQHQFIYQKGTIPAESVIKVKDDGEVKFESEKEHKHKFEEKFIVNRPPEKKIFEEVVEHEIEIDQPSYIDYEEKQIEKVIEVSRPPERRIIQEIVEREIEIPRPPKYKTITETIKVPIKKFPDPEKKIVQEVLTKEIVFQPPPQEITIERVIQEKIRPIGIKATGHPSAYMKEDEIPPIPGYVPAVHYSGPKYNFENEINSVPYQYSPVRTDNFLRNPQTAYLSRHPLHSPYIEGSPIRPSVRSYIPSPIMSNRVQYKGNPYPIEHFGEYPSGEKSSPQVIRYY